MFTSAPHLRVHQPAAARCCRVALVSLFNTSSSIAIATASQQRRHYGWGAAAQQSSTSSYSSGGESTTTYTNNGSSNSNGNSSHRPTSSSTKAAAAAAPRSSTEIATATLKAEVQRITEELQRRDATITQLRKKVAALEEAAAQSNQQGLKPSSATAEHPSWYPATAKVVTNAQELSEAIDNHTPDIVIKEGSDFDFVNGICAVGNTKITFYGTNPQAKQGDAASAVRLRTSVNVKSAKASLTFIGIELTGTKEHPVINVCSGGKLNLQHCTIAGGRDGVYLASQGSATISDCVIRDNIRGVMESLRCTAIVRNTKFENNLFHSVLLSPPKSGGDRCLRVTEDAYGKTGNTFKGGRCDVALMHNPITDSYTNCFKGEAPLELKGEQSSAGLVDQCW